jgi:hypothetical protein
MLFFLSHAPADPDRNGDAFRGIMFTDDALLVHPDVGMGIYLCQCCLCFAMVHAAGTGAWNTDKDLADAFVTRLLALGFWYDSELEEMSATTARLVKAFRILRDPAFAYGNYFITLHAVQVLYGNLRFLSTTCRCMLSFITVMRWFLATEDETGFHAIPSGSAQLKEYKFQRLWLTCEFLSVLVEDCRHFRTPVIQTFLGSFTPLERLALDGQRDKAVLLCSDASPSALFVANLKLREAIYFPWTQERAMALAAFLARSGVPPEEIPETTIAVLELIPPVLGFVHWGRDCPGALFMSLVDNSNAVTWIRSRSALTLAAMFTLHVLGRHEVLYTSELTACEVSTVANKVADRGSRPPEADAGNRDSVEAEREKLEAYLRSEVDPAFVLLPQSVGDDLFNHHLGCMTTNQSLRLATEPEDCLAERLSESRRRRDAWETALRFTEKDCVLSLGAGAGSFAGEALALGAGSVMLCEKSATHRALLLIRFGGEAVVQDIDDLDDAHLSVATVITMSSPTRPMHVPAYPGRDEDVSAVRTALSQALDRAPNVATVVVDFPVDFVKREPAEWESLAAEVRSRGFSVASARIASSSCGDTQDVWKLVTIMDRREEGEVPPAPPPHLVGRSRPPLLHCLVSPQQLPQAAWVEGEFEPLPDRKLDSAVRRAGFVDVGGQRHSVVSATGSARAIKAAGSGALGSGGQLLLDPRVTPPRVRALVSRECWNLSGLTVSLLEAWEDEAAMNLAPPATDAEVRRVAGGTLPCGLAQASLRWAIQAGRDLPPPQRHDLRVGSDGRPAPARQRLGDSFAPSHQWHRVGARTGRKRDRTEIVDPYTREEEAAMYAAGAMLSQRAIAEGTRVQYERGMVVFDNFVLRRGGQPGFLDPARYSDADIEELLIQFVAYQVVVLGYKATTVDGYLSAIRFWHLTNGLPNPISNKGRLALVRRGAKRFSGCSKPKVAVTPDMLKHIRSTLDLTSPEGALMWAALLLGFFYLLRCSEYLYCPGRVDDRKVLTVADILFARDGDDLPFHRRWEANRVNLHIRYAKNDQMGLGADVVCYATGEGEFCPIWAINNLLDHRPGVLGSEPLCMVGGKHLARGAMVTVLKQGATDLGQPEEDYATHSLRIGGATTMVNEGVAVETVRRHGRWTSIDMWRRYAHTTNDLTKGVSSVMARAKYTVAQASRDFRTRLL